VFGTAGGVILMANRVLLIFQGGPISYLGTAFSKHTPMLGMSIHGPADCTVTGHGGIRKRKEIRKITQDTINA